MNDPSLRLALLERQYHEYLVHRDAAGFERKVARHYAPATLERLLVAGPRLTRRAAAMALGLVGRYDSNMALGRALHDEDRGVRLLAESSLRNVWCRDGSPAQQQQLAEVIRLNSTQQCQAAIAQASDLIASAPTLAEGWNQRAIAYYACSRYVESLHDCREALRLNAFHFGAAAGLGQCHLQLGDQRAALECFRRALQINPVLEGIRANVSALERKLKG